MTAEIAILNRSAVALAADSAVTINTPTGPKIYDSVNKLFVLVKQRPVGIMIYNSADLLGLPWETIIKAYRIRNQDKLFDSLEDYASDFLRFITDTPELIPETLREKYFVEASTRRLQLVRLRIDEAVERRLTAGEKVGQAKLRKIIDEAIQAEIEVWDGQPDGDWATTIDRRKIELRYRSDIDTLLTDVFKKLPIVVRQKALIKKLLVLSMIKVPYFHSRVRGTVDPKSGLVVAGFGEKEFFPRLLEFEVSGIIDGILRITRRDESIVSPDSDAIIAPFAQSDMVDNFVTGINPIVRSNLRGYLRSLEQTFPDAVLDLIARQLPETGDSDVEALRGAVRSLILLTTRGFSDRLRELQEEQFTPILNSVAFLPKDELAAMAESLVNLTSLKRRVSDDPQTVGGPVDVAVISRGDGFVWIKRKHYFSQDLNPSWARSHAEG